MAQRNLIAPAIITAILLCCQHALAEDPKPVKTPAKDAGGWVSIFDGKSLDGWKVSTDSPKTFTVKDGAIVANGPRAHLFYAGKVADHNFKNFELKIDVMTKPSSNGGVYFHTEYQKGGWPGKGFEVQVNNTHKDPKKSGGLYGVKDVFKAPAKDGEWFTEHIIVRGKQITIKVNGKTLVEFTEPTPPKMKGGRVLSSGTFALQGHDPGSTVCYKNIRVKVLDDKNGEEGFTPLFDGKTLKGWKGRDPLWKVVDGAICGQSSKDTKLKHNDFLYTVKEYGDFELTLKYKLVNHNSGVQIRSKVHDDFRVTGYQADIAENRFTGILYEEGGRGIIADVKPKEISRFIKKKDWNDYRIVCRGKEVKFWINGQPTISYTEKKDTIATKGVIAFQLHAGPPMQVYYKDIRIKELPAGGGK